eukprot:EG_transcript_4980
MSAPPGEYERVLLRFGSAADGAAGGAVTAVGAVDPIAPHIRKVACSRAACLLLTQRGELYCVPTEAVAQPPASPHPLPAPLGLGGHRAVDIAAGDAHFLALSAGGKVFGWGNSDHGQVGTGSLKPQPSPRLLPGLDPFAVVGVAAGAAHSIAWTEAGFAYGFGRGEQGQLGVPGQLLQPAPHRIKTLLDRRVVAACAKGDATAFLDDAGQVWVCGDGTTGQLGQGHFRTLQIPVPLLLPPDIGWVLEVAMGWGHLVVRDDQLRVWTCGVNTKGQLGLGEAGRKYPTLQRVAVRRRCPVEDRALARPRPLPCWDLESGQLPPRFQFSSDPTPWAEADAAALPVDKVCAGEFWTGAVRQGQALLWGSFGPALPLHTAMECLNDHLPPHAAVVDVWPQQDSALVLVDLFLPHSPVDLRLAVATLGEPDLPGAKAFALASLARRSPQIIASAADPRLVGLTVALRVAGPEPVWPAVVAALTGSPATPHSVEAGPGHTLLHLPPDPSYRVRVLQAEAVEGCEVLIAQCRQTVAVTLYGPAGRLEKALDGCCGSQSEPRPLLPPLYTVQGYAVAE